jgi:hypothetical protein
LRSYNGFGILLIIEDNIGMTEINLTTNESHPIIKVDDVVHRPTGFWTPAVHSLLIHLEEVGYTGSPRVLGFDEQGREMLSFIDGDSGVVWWKNILSDEGLRKYARFVKQYHEAAAGYRIPEGLEAKWANGAVGLPVGMTICHGEI